MNYFNAKDILLISTGGTFNKIYEPISGELIVDSGKKAIEDISKKWKIDLNYKTIIQKDSLDMTQRDREELAETIISAKEEKIIVIHGTDTMDLSADFLANRVKDKLIVFTGAMIPFSIDETEASLNFALAIGFALGYHKKGVFIAMHGQIGDKDSLIKNRKEGKFQSL